MMNDYGASAIERSKVGNQCISVGRDGFGQLTLGGYLFRTSSDTHVVVCCMRVTASTAEYGLEPIPLPWDAVPSTAAVGCVTLALAGVGEPLPACCDRTVGCLGHRWGA